MTMIKTAVVGLDNLESIVPAVQNLGKNHVKYGVTAEMYDTVGASLLETLEAGLGADFTAEVKDAWTEVYTLLATTMKDAAYADEATAPAPVAAPAKPWWKFW